MANEVFTEVQQLASTEPDTRTMRWLMAAFAKLSPRVAIPCGSTLAMTRALYQGCTINLDTATGSVATLPLATGSGAKYKFRVSALATSNSHIVKCITGDKFEGFVFTMSDDPVTVKGFFAVAGTSATITLNRTTTGSVTIGEEITVEDVGANRYHVYGFTSSTGTEATPFS